MGYMNNKRGIAPIAIIGIIAGIILLIYLILFIPIPAFTLLRQSINYYLIVSIWVLLQITVVYAVYKIISLLTKGYKDYRQLIKRWDLNIKKWIMLH